MPLRKGTSQPVVSSNIKTLVDDWKKDGAIGSSHPKTKKKAIKQAVAIALSKAGKSRNAEPRSVKAPQTVRSPVCGTSQMRRAPATARPR